MRRYSKRIRRNVTSIDCGWLSLALAFCVGLGASSPLVKAQLAPSVRQQQIQQQQQPPIPIQQQFQYQPAPGPAQFQTPTGPSFVPGAAFGVPSIQQQPTNTADNMQANLRVLLNYLNDEPQAAATGVSQSRLITRSANPQQPTNVLVAVAPMRWNAQQQFQPSPNAPYAPRQAEYSQKVRRMAVPGIQPVGSNLLNFMQNGGENGQNLNYGAFLRPQNDARLPDPGEEEEGAAEEPDENAEEPIDENGTPIKFSKLAKPQSPSEGAKPVTGNPNKSDAKNTAKPLSLPQPQPPKTTQSPPPPSSSSPAKSATSTTGSTSPQGGNANGNTPGKFASGMVGANGGLGAGIISPQNKQGQVGFGNGADTNNAPRPPSILPQSGQLPMIVPSSVVQPRTSDPYSERIPSPSGPSQIGGTNPSAPKYNFKLIYFDARGICEPIRLLFHYAKVPFEDARITRRQWLALKDSTIYGKVPILEVDGKPLTYCHTISRFLARTFGLAGVSSWEQAKVDEISDFHSDVAMDLQPYLYVVAGFHQGDREALRKAIFLPSVEKHFQVYVNLLKQAGSGFFVQSGLTWIDFVISEYMTTIKHFEPAILDKYPALMKFVRKVQSLPEIFDYIANREHQPV